MELKELLKKAYELGGSDVFIVPGARVTCKVKGDMVPLTEDIVRPDGTEKLIREAYELAHRDIALLKEEGDDYRKYRPESKKIIGSCASIALTIKSVLDTPLLTENGSLTKESKTVCESAASVLE